MIELDLLTSYTHEHLLTVSNTFTECLIVYYSHKEDRPLLQFCFF